jgi:phosphatidylethanolamine/phosphatidyl-N-methylethanolamine N-methyltransferase
MPGTGTRKSLAARFDDEVQFFKGWLHRPRAVGSIVPTSSVTAKRMASIVDLKSGLPVLELGPGTGVITKAILQRGVPPEKLYAVEYSPEFVRHLKLAHPKVNFIHGDAFNLGETLGSMGDATFDSAISGVPLLNFPVAERIKYVEGILDRLPPGRPMVQLTYGPKSPVPPGLGNYNVEHFRFVLRNIPPTQLWIYRRKPN